MVLIGDTLFGDARNEFFNGTNKFTLGRDRVGLTIVSPGNTVVGTSTFVASELKTERKNVGVAVSYSANNQTGSNRNINVTVTNVTKATTLYNFDLVVGGNSSITDNMFFSIEQIEQGDTVSITLGGDGIGTAGTSGGTSTVTSYWSAPGIAWSGKYFGGGFGDEFILYDSSGTAENDGGGDSMSWSCPVELPHGAIITSVVVYGSASDENWQLNRSIVSSSSNGNEMANANFNSIDSSVSYSTIDNANYRYWFETSTLDDPDRIYSARIIYTIETATAGTASAAQGSFYVKLNSIFMAEDETEQGL